MVGQSHDKITLLIVKDPFCKCESWKRNQGRKQHLYSVYTKNSIDLLLGAGAGFGLVLRVADWHAGDLGSNPQQAWPLYIWMYTPAL
jgi:hypothetical protein